MAKKLWLILGITLVAVAAFWYYRVASLRSKVYYLNIQLTDRQYTKFGIIYWASCDDSSKLRKLLISEGYIAKDQGGMDYSATEYSKALPNKRVQTVCISHSAFANDDSVTFKPDL